jgi:hypothetical protein
MENSRKTYRNERVIIDGNASVCEEAVWQPNRTELYRWPRLESLASYRVRVGAGGNLPAPSCVSEIVVSDSGTWGLYRTISRSWLSAQHCQDHRGFSNGQSRD